MEQAQQPRGRRVAVVGSGIAGMSTAYHLAKHGIDLQVHLFEADDRLGGHEMPLETRFGTIDLGFMILNHVTYPNLMRFYGEHQIPIVPTDMSFGIETPDLSFSFKGTLSLIVRHGLSPDFWKFVADKHRFHREARVFLSTIDPENPPRVTVGEFCQQHGYSDAFVKGFLAPFCEAVWSADKTDALGMEAYTILAFLRNHGFLNWSTIPWYTPHNRTTVTLNRFKQLFRQLGVHVHLSSPVAGVLRLADKGTVQLLFPGQRPSEEFDDVVLATPSGTALPMLREPTSDDVRILAGFRSTQTELVVHSDPSLMPRRGAWCSWNVLEGVGTQQERPVLSYWVQSLQHIAEKNLFITLNPPANAFETKDESLVHYRCTVSHPIMDLAAQASQRAVWSHHQGQGKVWYAGAYLHYGFHEDGFRSGIEVARALLKDTTIPLMPVAGHSDPVHLAFQGTTVHARYNPATGEVVHKFSYPLSYDYIDVDVGFTAWWGGLFRRDHFGDPTDSLSVAVRKEVARQCGTWPTGCVDIITLVREYSYVFNPITVFLCWSDERRVEVTHVVTEVSNTPWGQRTVHVLPVAEARKGSDQTWIIERRKTLHVSPFNPVPDGSQTWRYTMTLPDAKLAGFQLTVDLFEDPACTRKKIMATMNLTNAGAAPTWHRGLLPRAAVVQARIHWQALLLFTWKKIPFHSNTTQYEWSELQACDLFPWVLLLAVAAAALLLQGLL